MFLFQYNNINCITGDFGFVLKGALSQEFCCFQLHSLLKSLPGTFTRSQNAQMDLSKHIKEMPVAQRANYNEFLAKCSRKGSRI